MEAILGPRVKGNVLHLSPCIPGEWRTYTMTYRHHSATYVITVDNAAGVMWGITELEMDGVRYPTEPTRMPLHDDGALHRVSVTLGDLPADRPND